MLLQEHVSLKPFNTFGIDAEARYYLQVATVQTLRDFLEQAHLRSLPQLVLGGGSNILLLDDFKGVVL
ncbi:MAG: UDP-N-acetylenolpyruvoylglucosamine reductase, partial [Bacteroidota bacterium]